MPSEAEAPGTTVSEKLVETTVFVPGLDFVIFSIPRNPSVQIYVQLDYEHRISRTPFKPSRNLASILKIVASKEL